MAVEGKYIANKHCCIVSLSVFFFFFFAVALPVLGWLDCSSVICNVYDRWRKWNGCRENVGRREHQKRVLLIRWWRLRTNVLCFPIFICRSLGKGACSHAKYVFVHMCVHNRRATGCSKIQFSCFVVVVPAAVSIDKQSKSLSDDDGDGDGGGGADDIGWKTIGGHKAVCYLILLNALGGSQLMVVDAVSLWLSTGNFHYWIEQQLKKNTPKSTWISPLDYPKYIAYTQISSWQYSISAKYNSLSQQFENSISFHIVTMSNWAIHFLWLRGQQ